MRMNEGGRRNGLLFKAMVAALLIVAASSSSSIALAAPSISSSGNVPASCQQSSSLARLACLSGAGSPSGQKRGGPPAGARAVCRDGSYSYSQNRWVACRFHGGVGRWLG